MWQRPATINICSNMGQAKFLPLLVMLLLNNFNNCCVCFRVADGTNNQTTTCPYAIPHKNDTGLLDSIHQTDCPGMEASLYSHRVQAAAVSDSLQATEFSATGPTNLTGHFEFEHSLTPADTLLILLGDAEEFGPGHECRRLAVCSQSADGQRRRLRLSVSLRPDRSYTMKIFKLANGSALCEPPKVRFFFTRSTAAERPLLQLAARRCGRCGDGRPDADFGCELDAYLLADRPERLRLRVQEPDRGPDGIHGFNSTSNEVWATQSIVVKISNKLGITLLVDFFKDSKFILAARRQFHAIRSKGVSMKKLLYPQLCQPTFPRNDSCRCPATDNVASAGQLNILAAAFLTLAASLCLLALLSSVFLVVVVRRRKIRTGSRSVLVLPDQGDDYRRRAAVRRLQGKLEAFGFDVSQIVKLRRLTRKPQIVRSSRHIIFVSWDETFQCFQIGSLPDEEHQLLRTLLLVEKHRVRGFYLESESVAGRAPQATESATVAFWSSVKSRQLGVGKASIKSSARWLLAELHLQDDNMDPSRIESRHNDIQDLALAET